MLTDFPGVVAVCSATDPAAEYPERIASRVAERVYLVELATVTHFYAQDKLTYAMAGGRSYPVDHSIAPPSPGSAAWRS